jgi:Na+/H+-dicarboxylate symporter
MSLTNRILLAMVLGIGLGSVLEVVLGSLSPDSSLYGFLYNGMVMGLFDVLGRIFIASLKLLVVPLVLVSLICGMAALGASSRMGPIAGKTLGLYLVTTCIAVSLGLAIALAVGPGEGVNAVASSDFVPKEAPPIKETLINIFPTNPVAAMAEGQHAPSDCFRTAGGICINACW